MLDKNEGLKEKFIRKGFWIYLFSFIVGPIGYLTKMLLSADLSVEEMGILYGIISFILLIGTYNDLGLTESLNFFLPKFAVEKRYAEFKTALLYAVTAQAASSVLIGSGLFFGAEWLAEAYFKSPAAEGVLKVFCLYFFLSNLLQISSTLFAVVQDTKLQNFLGFIRSTFSLLFIGSLWFFWHGNLQTYAWAWVFPLVITLTWSFSVLYKKTYLPYLKEVPFAHSRDLLVRVSKYAFLVLLTANVGVVLSQVDMQLIILLLWPKEAGYYTNYLSLIGIPFLLITPLIGFLFPVISSMSEGGDRVKIATIKSFFSKYFAAAAVPVSFVLALFGPDFAVAFFGEKFRESGRVLSWSAPFLVFNFLLQINFQILGGTGKVKERLKIITAGLACNVPLNLLLIPMFGISGSALAVGLSWIPVWYWSNRTIGPSAIAFDWKFFGKNLFFMGAVSILSFWAWQSPSVYPFFSTRIHVVVGLSILTFIHIISFVLVNLAESRELLREVLAMLPKKKSSA